MQMEWTHEDGHTLWLLGLGWLPVVGQLTAVQARQLAKKHKAKQWIVAGHTFRALGLSYKRRRKQKKHQAAAMAYAVLHPKGAHAAVFCVNESLYWLVAAKEGTPMRHGDKLFTTERAAQQALLQLHESHPELNFISQIQRFSDFSILLTARILEQTATHGLPRPFWSTSLVFILLMVGVYWWQFEPSLEAAPVPEPAIDPYLSYWHKQKIQPNGRSALAALLTQWRRLPLELGGWQFKEASCRAQASQWACTYDYSAKNSITTSAEFEGLLPEHWQIQSMDLQSVRVEQQVAFQTEYASWYSTENLRSQLLTPLQHHRAAFSVLRFTELSPLLKVSASTFSPIYRQGLHIEGPLRSVALLLELGHEVHWSTLKLQHKPRNQLSLTSSALSVNLQGVVYVRD